MTLTRDDEHRYFLGRLELPGVTTVLETLGLRDKYPHSNAPREGTAVHLATALHDQGELERVGPALEPYLDEYKRFLAMYHPEFLRIEQMLYHPVLMYACQIDREAIITGKRFVIYLKLSDYKVARCTDLQTMAYAVLVSNRPEDALSITRAAVRLSSKGKDPHVTIFEDNETSLRAWLGAVDLYRWVIKSGITVTRTIAA